MPGYSLTRSQRELLERAIWAQATRVHPRPQLVLLTPGEKPGEEIVRASTLAALHVEEFFADLLRAVPRGPPVVSNIENAIAAYAQQGDRLLPAQTGQRWIKDEAMKTRHGDERQGDEDSTRLVYRTRLATILSILCCYLFYDKVTANEKKLKQLWILV